jgi:hypothetical protein
MARRLIREFLESAMSALSPSSFLIEDDSDLPPIPRLEEVPNRDWELVGVDLRWAMSELDRQRKPS